MHYFQDYITIFVFLIIAPGALFSISLDLQSLIFTNSLNPIQGWPYHTASHLYGKEA
jgi:NADH:ubiquinone oxidoreductase subunit 3 (subunit A)